MGEVNKCKNCDLGEAEQVTVKDDKELEIEIVNNLRKQCIESEKSICV